MATPSRNLEAEAESKALAVPSSGSTPYERLHRGLELFRGKSQLVLLIGVPDPDAISAALALQQLGNLHEIETTILCFQVPSHHENRALVKRLGINLITYDEHFDFSSYAAYSIVDSQKFRTPIDQLLADNHVQFLAFIDHHREDAQQPPAMFVDIRPSISSTAGIFAEYLKAAFPKGLESTDAEHVRLATALMHGLRSDTKRFSLATPLEYDAAAFIAPCVDHQVIERIEHRVLSSAVLGILENALVRRRVHDNFVLSDVGFVRAAERDGIPQAADLLLSREGTDTVLVVGIVDEKIIDGSLRTTSQTINPDQFLKGLLGISPESGQYYGGGNFRDRGGFQIPLGFLGLHGDREQVYKMALEIIERAFLKHIGMAEAEATKLAKEAATPANGGKE